MSAYCISKIKTGFRLKIHCKAIYIIERKHQQYMYNHQRDQCNIRDSVSDNKKKNRQYRNCIKTTLSD